MQPSFDAVTNRRSRRRATLSVPVLVDALSQYWLAHSRDVSEVGLGVRLAADLPVGKVVQVYFELPTLVPIEAEASVVRCSDSTLGLHFHALDRQQRTALESYCQQWLHSLFAACARRATWFEQVELPTPAAEEQLVRTAEFTPDELRSAVRMRAAPDSLTLARVRAG
jgi:hypothetical protein